MKRIVFFSCRCTSKSCDSSYDDDDEEMTEDLANDDLNILQPSWTFSSLNFSKSANNANGSSASVKIPQTPSTSASSTSNPVSTMVG